MMNGKPHCLVLTTAAAVLTAPLSILPCLVPLLLPTLHAQQPIQPDKSGFHLLHPAPAQWMREFSTDRPDQTESPYTVDAGHFQMEADAVTAEFDRDRADGRDLGSTSWGSSVNLKAGLLNNMDIQFVLDPYAHSRVEDRVAGTVDQASGIGDLQTRLKINLWGNDGGTTAFAVMPFVKWPLAASELRNGQTEGGCTFILGCELPAGWSVTAMHVVDFVAGADRRHDTGFVNSVTLGHDIVGRLAGYVEFYSVVSTDTAAPWQGQADIGFTYLLDKHTQLDFGCNFGVTRSAPDFNPFLGFSLRF